VRVKVEQEQAAPAVTEKTAQTAEEKTAELQAAGKPVNLGPTVNSSFNDISPTLSPDGLTLLFHSNRPGGLGMDDLWMCRRVALSEPFSQPVNLGPAVNSRFNDACPALSSDGLMLLFHSNRPSGQGKHDLWMCTRTSLSEPFSEPVNMGPNVNSSFEEFAPALSGDGLTLLFWTGAARPGGQGGRDLWMCRRSSVSEPFGKPVNLGPTVNSSFEEYTPALSADGLTLLFASNRPGGLGNRDLWLCARTSLSEPFGEPVNLGPTVNSEFGEHGPSLPADGPTLLFNSNRPGGQGGGDLWMLTE
jgi:Tol biopolymer transport system component